MASNRDFYLIVSTRAVALDIMFDHIEARNYEPAANSCSALAGLNEYLNQRIYYSL